MWQSAHIIGVRRIIKRTRALAGNAAGLPVIVLVEAANPAVVIHRHVEMHFVAARAEFRRSASRMNGFRKVRRCGSGFNSP